MRPSRRLHRRCEMLLVVHAATVDGFVDAGFTQQEAECLADNVTLEELANAENSDELLEIFARCGISLDRLAELGN